MIRGFTPIREEKTPVSVRLSASSRSVVDIITEAINHKFEESYIESKVTMTDVFEEVIANSIFNNKKAIQVDDQFYSMNELLISYLDKKFSNIICLNEIISKEELLDALKSAENIKENIQDYFSRYRKAMRRRNVDDILEMTNNIKYRKEQLYTVYKKYLQLFESEHQKELQDTFKTKTKKELLNNIISLQQFRGIDVFLKLNKNKELIWFNKLQKIIDSFVENVIINDQTNVFNDFIDQSYEPIL